MIHKFLTLLETKNTKQEYKDEYPRRWDMYTTTYDDYEQSIVEQLQGYDFHALFEYPMKIFGFDRGPAWVYHAKDDPELGPIKDRRKGNNHIIVMLIPLDYLSININIISEKFKPKYTGGRNNHWYKSKGWNSLVVEDEAV